MRRQAMGRERAGLGAPWFMTAGCWVENDGRCVGSACTLLPRAHACPCHAGTGSSGAAPARHDTQGHPSKPARVLDSLHGAAAASRGHCGGGSMPALAPCTAFAHTCTPLIPCTSASLACCKAPPALAKASPAPLPPCPPTPGSLHTPAPWTGGPAPPPFGPSPARGRPAACAPSRSPSAAGAGILGAVWGLLGSGLYIRHSMGV